MGDWTVITKPTISSNGLLKRSCTDSGCTYEEQFTLPFFDTTAYTNVKMPTTSADGEGKYTFEFGGTSYTVTVTVDKHVMGSWTETIAPTAAAAGQLTRTCENCTYTETYTLPILSSANVGDGKYTYKVTKDPTVEAEGEGTYTITVDGQTFTYKVTIPKVEQSGG